MTSFEEHAYVLLGIVYTVALSFSVFVTWYSYGAADRVRNGWRNSLLLRARCSALTAGCVAIMFALVVALSVVDGLEPIPRSGGLVISVARFGVFYVMSILLSAVQLTIYLSTTPLFKRKDEV
jgi:hypothetical protein